MAEFNRRTKPNQQNFELIGQKLAQTPVKPTPQIQVNPTPQPSVKPTSIDIKTIGVILGIITTIWGAIWWYRNQRRSSKFPINTTPFKVLPAKSDILSVVFPGDKNNPLSDARIKYQQRLSARDIKQELIEQLESQNWLLILGRTGLGKTREAAEVAQVFNQEGWTVLYLQDWEWLDLPTRKQLQELDQNRKVLFFLDDLNRKMAFGLKDKSPKAENSPLEPLTKPLQTRLLETIKEYQEICDQIKVIATARNETQPNDNNQISEWDKLQWDKYTDFWQKFTVFELPPPEDDAIVKLFQDTIRKTGIAADESDYLTIAKRNDSTFRNAKENIVRVKNRKLAFTVENYRDTLTESWNERYQTAINKYPIAKYIYDAIDLLRQIGIPLAKTTVVPTTKLLMGVKKWQFWHTNTISQALVYLAEAENIYQPRDGQIEAKGNSIELKSSYLLDLYNFFYPQKSTKFTEKIPTLWALLISLDKYEQYPKVLDLCDYLIDYFDNNSELLLILWVIKGVALGNLDKYEEAIKFFNKVLEIKPNHDEAWNNLGVALGDLGKHDEAIASFDKALKIKPDYDLAWNNRGGALNDLGKHDEAIASFDKALEIKPDYDLVWNNRGVVLSHLAEYEQAIASYNKALEIKTDYYEAWHNRGVALSHLDKYEEAIVSYDKALAIKPDYQETWYSRGVDLGKLNRLDEAIVSYDKALEIKPDYYAPWHNRSAALRDLGRLNEAITSSNKALEINPDYDAAWNNRGITLTDLGKYEDAIASFDKALEINPDYDAAWNNRGITLTDLGKYEDAIASFDKALEINHNLKQAWNNLDITLEKLRQSKQ
ncbi:MAG: tetratricopeptide repeat protein [Xenococcaceae cyanobacterium MO_188.B19]|nr:tetratricopeptide repeat protein [Xenococcaceae cyanobacterium MO_188.B19]